MNKETLEELVDRLPNKKVKELGIFLQGAKWQMERSYSKEEVDKLLDRLLENNLCSHAGDELIEQFKKK